MSERAMLESADAEKLQRSAATPDEVQFARSIDAPVELRAEGPLTGLDAGTRARLVNRSGASESVVRRNTAAIVERVRTGGDDALRAMAREFDGAVLDSLEVPRAACDRALSELEPGVRAALERAARNIDTVHRAFLPRPVQVSPEPGITVGRRPDPLARVGVYAPGGRAAYPSSLLMGAIPARVAGVGEIIVCSPPGPSGLPSTVVLAAAALAGVDRVFAVGGAGAIAAMALGTSSIPRVDRIVGPGNSYVAEAKLQLVSEVAIDAPAGPSELLVLADEHANPATIARELVAQAEHDPEAAVIAVIAGSQAPRLAAEIGKRLAAETAAATREAIVRQALRARGAIVTVEQLDDAIAFANEWAAEHLLLLVQPQLEEGALQRLRGAGTVFVGECSSVAFGDYMTGANHVLPTAGAARCYSGLSTLDFVRWTTWQHVTRDAASELARDVACFADAEGLPAHAAAARAWLDEPARATPQGVDIETSRSARGAS